MAKYKRKVRGKRKGKKRGKKKGKKAKRKATKKGKRRKKKGEIPIGVLEKRVVKLNNVIRRRKGNAFTGKPANYKKF